MRLRTVAGCGVLACLLACGGSEESGGAGVLITIPDGYRLGGTATGVAGELSLSDAAAGQVTLTRDGPFWFPARLPVGTQYQVALSGSIPSDAFCSISNAAGTMPRGDTGSILVSCQALSSPSGD